MQIFEAIKRLDDKATILTDNLCDTFQKYTDSQIYVTYNQDRMKEENSSSIGGSIDNDDFIKKYKDNEFSVLTQWYQSEYKLPILCWVTTGEWQFSKKLVQLNYKGANQFNTGFGESYSPSYHTKIVPLTDDEIDELKQGF